MIHFRVYPSAQYATTNFPTFFHTMWTAFSWSHCTTRGHFTIAITMSAARLARDTDTEWMTGDETFEWTTREATAQFNILSKHVFPRRTPRGEWRCAALTTTSLGYHYLSLLCSTTRAYSDQYSTHIEMYVRTYLSWASPPNHLIIIHVVVRLMVRQTKKRLLCRCGYGIILIPRR